MRRKKTKTLNKIMALAAIAGIRSMAAPALLSSYLKAHPSKRLKRSSLAFMQTEKAANTFKMLAAAEMLGDKLPFAPDRIKPMALIGRALSGALVGATLSRTSKKRKLGGGVIGLVSAVISSYVIFYVRKELAKSSIIPDSALGALEDILVVKGGQRLFEQ